jgi:chromosomal replication initiator protein
MMRRVASAGSRGHATAVPTFVAGPENRLAPVAVESVLGDDDGYNPLVFHGASGTGKSHLALGLATAWKARFRGRPAIYVTASDFRRQLADALQTKTVDDFAARYHRLSLLVLEDVHHLAGNRAAQHELLFLFDALMGAGSRLVFTSSVLPGELSGMLLGLKSRLAGGLTVPLVAPGPEARLVILRRLAEAQAIPLEEAAAEILADGLSMTAPELSGTIKQLSGPAGNAIPVEAARRFVAQHSRSQEPSVPQIAAATARYFSLPVADVTGRSRRRQVATARAVAMYLAHSLTGSSLQAIGAYFGGRDHATVSHGCQMTEERLDTDPQIREAVLRLQERLKSRQAAMPSDVENVSLERRRALDGR